MNLFHAAARKWRFPGKCEPECFAQRVDVGAHVERRMFKLFWTGECWRTDKSVVCQRLRIGRGVNCFGQTEIDCREDGRLYELGRGAMGVTYRATDTTLQRKVALKIIQTDIAERSADARERFMREARAAAALRHENIAVIHQFGMRLETGQYFYAMELIEGETLDERVRQGFRPRLIP